MRWPRAWHTDCLSCIIQQPRHMPTPRKRPALSWAAANALLCTHQARSASAVQRTFLAHRRSNLSCAVLPVTGAE